MNESDYRERALKLFPWVCGRCCQEFAGKNLRLLTVHHKDHNHNNNPPDGSNWELLCVYCHDNEHAKYDFSQAPQTPNEPSAPVQKPSTTYKALEGLADLLKKQK